MKQLRSLEWACRVNCEDFAHWIVTGGFVIGQYVFSVVKQPLTSLFEADFYSLNGFHALPS